MIISKFPFPKNTQQTVSKCTLPLAIEAKSVEQNGAHSALMTSSVKLVLFIISLGLSSLMYLIWHDQSEDADKRKSEQKGLRRN